MFSPKDLVPAESKLTLESIVQTLDTRFKKLVDESWFNTWYSDRIYLHVNKSKEPDLYNAIVQNREGLVNLYSGAGWSSVTIKTSDENGERAGLINIELSIKSSTKA